MTYFEKLNQDKARRVTNVLVESPFFYREDDENLFLYLSRYKASFRRFFEECFGWELLVEPRCARVIKSSWQNPALNKVNRDMFDFRGRADCLGFLLVLEFYEHLLDEQNLSVDDADCPRFYFGSLYDFARERLAEELGDTAMPGPAVRKMLRRVVEQLLRYRFLRELAPESDDHVDRDNLIYECLPGLYCYDLRRLGPDAVRRFVDPNAGADGGSSRPGEDAR